MKYSERHAEPCGRHPLLGRAVLGMGTAGLGRLGGAAAKLHILCGASSSCTAPCEPHFHLAR